MISYTLPFVLFSRFSWNINGWENIEIVRENLLLITVRGLLHSDAFLEVVINMLCGD